MVAKSTRAPSEGPSDPAHSFSGVGVRTSPSCRRGDCVRGLPEKSHRGRCGGGGGEERGEWENEPRWTRRGCTGRWILQFLLVHLLVVVVSPQEPIAQAPAPSPLARWRARHSERMCRADGGGCAGKRGAGSGEGARMLGAEEIGQQEEGGPLAPVPYATMDDLQNVPPAFCSDPRCMQAGTTSEARHDERERESWDVKGATSSNPHGMRDVYTCDGRSVPWPGRDLPLSCKSPPILPWPGRLSLACRARNLLSPTSLSRLSRSLSRSSRLSLSSSLAPTFSPSLRHNPHFAPLHPNSNERCFIFFLITLATGPSRPCSLASSDVKVPPHPRDHSPAPRTSPPTPHPPTTHATTPAPYTLNLTTKILNPKR